MLEYTIQEMQLEKVVNDGWWFVIASHVRIVHILYYLCLSVFDTCTQVYIHANICVYIYMFDIYTQANIDIDIDIDIDININNTHLCICAMHVVCVHELCV